MKNFLLLFFSIVLSSNIIAQTWQSVLADSPYNSRLFIYEEADQSNLIATYESLYTLDIDGNVTSNKVIDWGDTYGNKFFNNNQIYSVDNSDMGISIRKFDHQGNLMDTLLVLDADHAFYDLILNEDGSFYALKYIKSIHHMHVASFDSDGNELKSTLLGTAGTRPRSIYKRADGRIIGYDSSNGRNLFFLDQNLDVVSSPSRSDYVIHNLVVTDANRIYIAGTSAPFSLNENFIAEIDENGVTLNEYKFTEADFEGGGNWVQSLSSVIFDLSLVLSTPELNDQLTMLCLDGDLNIYAINSFRGDESSINLGSQFYSLGQAIPNQNGGYTFGHGVKDENGDNYPVIIKTNDDCFVDLDQVLAYSAIDFKAKELDSKVLLNWTIDTEEDILGITVQHSQDGNQFVNIKEFEGSIDLSTPFEYLHESPSDGDNYYRLEIETVTGKLIHSELQYIRFLTNTFLAYPNPVSDVLTVESTDLIHELEIYNTVGHLLFKKDQIYDYKEFVDINRLTKGIYQLKLLSNEGIQSTTFVKN